MMPPRRTVLLLALCLASAVFYLGFSYVQLGQLSYPLDDAWIHLTFARNLALRHEFAFLPGQPSAGSTSPLWTFALVPGFLWPFGPDAWVYLVGVVLLLVGALLTADLAGRLFPDLPALSTVSAIAFALEWHLNWAAYSGMETLFFVVMLLLLLDAYFAGRPLWLVGLLGGLTVTTRPEGVVMLGLIAAHGMLRTRCWKVKGGRWKVEGGRWRLGVGGWRYVPAARVARPPLAGQGCGFGIWNLEFGLWDFVLMAFAFIAPLLPYLWFNWTTSGLLFPNTFYAKQAEFAEITAQKSALEHFLRLLMVTLIGAQALLIPGLLYSLWLIIRERRWDVAILVAWWLLLCGLYALRLPSDFQHGRYEMPAIPMLSVVGLWGTWRLSARLLAKRLGHVLKQAWTISFFLLLVAFWVLGGQQRAVDAAIMDCLVVQTAHWLDAHTQPTDVIAVHDIGAVGYYLNERPLIDLVGLVTPDVITFVRDEPRLMRYIRAHNASYLVTSAAWHPHMIRDPSVQEIYNSDCALSRRAGGYDMGIYRIIPP